MKNILVIIKRIILSLCILYAFNLLTSKIGFYIPLNFYTIISISILDFPGLITLILLSAVL
mgnify:CR=1 FL=1